MIKAVCLIRKLNLCALLVIVVGSGGLLLTRVGGAEELSGLDMRKVKVGGEIGRRIDITVKNNLLKLDIDNDFLKRFRERNRKNGYIGLGKTIDCAVRFAAYTNDKDVLALKKYLVDEVIKVQEADGYVGMMVPDKRMIGMWDIHEMGYLVNGLVSDYEFFQESRSLEAAGKLADYIIGQWSKLPPDWDKQTKISTHVSVTGLERAFVRLGRETGESKYRDFCIKERALPEWDLDIVIGRRPRIDGHIYAYLCRTLGQLELFRDVGDRRLLKQADRALDFMCRQDGCCITGGCGQWEIWTDDQDTRGELAETCATAYQIRVYDSLLRLRGESNYGDLMERTIYNTLFAAQSPDGRKIRYYTAAEGERKYHPGDAYCCPCNYRRIISDLPTFIYYVSDDDVVVNLYTPSRGEMELEDGVKVIMRQETEYPSSGKVEVVVEPEQAAKFGVLLRIPKWCKDARVAVNGEMIKESIEGGEFFEVERKWNKGDRITLDLPMDWRLVKGRKRQAGRVAVMRGPLLFCLNPDQNKEISSWDGVDLGKITLDDKSLGEPIKDDTIRPGGIACAVEAFKPSHSLSTKGDLKLVLTEFTDPNGKDIYFRLRDFKGAVDDELFMSH